MYIASAAFTFPDVKMIMAHVGGESGDQALHAASMLPNVYLDISVTGQWKYMLNPENFYRWLRNLIDEAGPWKILFATDWPQPDLWIPLAKWVKAIKEPKTEVRFTPEEIEIILGRAAQRVFGIPDDFRSSSQ
jgi:predicted TIM-barrel fold metal-dependent hydrolase